LFAGFFLGAGFDAGLAAGFDVFLVLLAFIG
jgi:hypothetical protein